MKFSLVVILFISSKLFVQGEPWIAPSESHKIINPIILSDNALNIGEQLYLQHCVMCHGLKGRGDGISGIGLTPRPANFNNKTFTEQSDGAIFWKINTGKPPKLPFKEVLSSEEIWYIIHYIRSFNTKSK